MPNKYPEADKVVGVSDLPSCGWKANQKQQNNKNKNGQRNKAGEAQGSAAMQHSGAMHKTLSIVKIPCKLISNNCLCSIALLENAHSVLFSN